MGTPNQISAEDQFPPRIIFINIKPLRAQSQAQGCSGTRMPRQSMGNEQSRYQSVQSPGFAYHLLCRVSKSGVGGSSTLICVSLLAVHSSGASGPFSTRASLFCTGPSSPRDSVWPLYTSATAPASLQQDFSAGYSYSTLGHTSSKCHCLEDKLNELGTEGSSTA